MEQGMNITIFGAGRVGGTLGRNWAKKGHSVTFGVRDPSDPEVRKLVDEIGANARSEVLEKAAADAGTVVLCTPWAAVEEIIGVAGDLAGKTLIDVTNPVVMTPEGLRDGLVLGHTTSAAEQIARWLPGVHVVKAFNTTGWQNMANPTYATQPLTMMLCGDDDQAKGIVADLARDVGFAPVDVGPLKSARYLEAMAMLWIDMAVLQGFASNFAFQIVKR
jgi:predicted dinucleotide-binding enzyme